MRRKCFQREVREQKEQQDTTKFAQNLDLSPEKAEVKVITKDEAKELILAYEWLGSLPAGAFLYVGLFLDGVLSGAEVFTETKAGSYYSLWNEKAVCLARGCAAYWCPKWASSFLISRALKIIEAYYNQEPRYVIAYSDWESGEIGTVYQACNWYYIRQKRKREWREPNGKRRDHNTHRDIAKQIDPEFKIKKLCNPIIVEQVKQDLLSKGWKQNKTMRGTYVTVIGKKCTKKRELLAKLEEHKLPYPKDHTEN